MTVLSAGRAGAASTIVHVGTYSDHSRLAHFTSGKPSGPEGGIVSCRWQPDGKLQVLNTTSCLNPAFMR